jgi:hypothetical protein
LDHKKGEKCCLHRCIHINLPFTYKIVYRSDVASALEKRVQLLAAKSQLYEGKCDVLYLQNYTPLKTYFLTDPQLRT